MSAGFYFVAAWVFVCLGLLALGQVEIHVTLARVERKVDALLKRGDL